MVSMANDMAALFVRDFTKVVQEIEAFPDDGALWRTCPGISNSAGNLALHLEGNLRDFIGRVLGGIAFTRQRDLEFSTSGPSRTEVAARLRPVAGMLHSVVGNLVAAQMEAPYPLEVLGRVMSTQQFLMHLDGHLNYHLGQIDYLRRFFTGHGAIEFAKLEP